MTRVSVSTENKDHAWLSIHEFRWEHRAAAENWMHDGKCWSALLLLPSGDEIELSVNPAGVRWIWIVDKRYADGRPRVRLSGSAPSCFGAKLQAEHAALKLARHLTCKGRAAPLAEIAGKRFYEGDRLPFPEPRRLRLQGRSIVMVWEAPTAPVVATLAPYAVYRRRPGSKREFLTHVECPHDFGDPGIKRWLRIKIPQALAL